MRTIRTVAEMRAWLGNARAERRTVGLVPTMGAFHAGHHSLMRAARAEMDAVVVSLFVNPAQFNDASDLAAYPRSEANDAVEAADLGVDVLFAPPTSEIYPESFATTVSVGGLSEVLEGAERGPGHFAGVCTVVCKLLNIIAPDAAYFGQKDAQQVAVVRRMARDLDLPARKGARRRAGSSGGGPPPSPSPRASSSSPPPASPPPSRSPRAPAGSRPP